ncbi:MAG TPA: biotin/lipoyl-containing protein [Armatimonadota bacterium]|jgi:acetyl-CoA carboxylase biotin carboxyl carrier protein
MDDTRLEASELRQLIDLVEREGLAELEVREKDVRVVLRTQTARSAAPLGEVPVGPLEAAAGAPAGAQPTPVKLRPEEDPRFLPVLSPMTGCFFRAPGPGDPPFIEMGDHVEEGQTIGLIEAMKVFSEIPSEVEGRVVALPVANGDMVAQGQVLVVVDPSGPRGSGGTTEDV